MVKVLDDRIDTAAFCIRNHNGSGEAFFKFGKLFLVQLVDFSKNSHDNLIRRTNFMQIRVYRTIDFQIGMTAIDKMDKNTDLLALRYEIG